MTNITTNTQTITLIKSLISRIDKILPQNLPPNTRTKLQLLRKELERYFIYFSILPESEYFLTRLVDAALDKNYLINNNPELQELFKLYKGYELIAISYIDSLAESSIDIVTQQKLMDIKSILNKQQSGYHDNYMLICLKGLLGISQEQIISNLITQLKGKINIHRHPKYYGAKNVRRT